MSGQRLDGWGEIAERLSEHARVSISKEQAKRYEKRPTDPLPVKRIGRFVRQRVVAEADQVDAWAKREYGQ
jgi:hypothetical protein